jgi:hypothetical protein
MSACRQPLLSLIAKIVVHLAHWERQKSEPVWLGVPVLGRFEKRWDSG